MVRKFKPGDQVALVNPNTRYGYNSIPRGCWCNGETYKVLSNDGMLAEGPTYYIEVAGQRRHVVETMLDFPGGPW